jgi:hypothetical protein
MCQNFQEKKTHKKSLIPTAIKHMGYAVSCQSLCEQLDLFEWFFDYIELLM